MKLRYTPDDAPAQEWDFDASKLMVVELEAIERFTGLGFVEFGEALSKGSPKALRALVWVVRKRSEPTLKYADVDFAIGDLSFESDEDEEPGEPEEDGDGSVLPKDGLRAVVGG